MRKVLITGATGFIGRNLAEYFACQPNFEVYGTYFSSPPLDHPNIRMLHANLTGKMDVLRVVERIHQVGHQEDSEPEPADQRAGTDQFNQGD